MRLAHNATRRTYSLLAGLLGLAFVLRAYHLDIPFVEPYNSLSRQAMVATIARNFYQHGFNFIYPEIDENGAGPSLFNGEMPIYSYLMAAGYVIAGGVREWVARSVPFAASLATLAMLWGLVLRRRGTLEAAATVFLLSVSPLFLALSRSAQPDMPMLLAGTGALFALVRHYETGRDRYFWLSALSMFAAFAMKIHAVYFVAPLAYLAWTRRGPAAFSEMKTYGYAAIVSLALVWYAAMWRAGINQHLLYQPYDFFATRAAPGLPLWRLFLPPFVNEPVKIFCVHLLTPLGAIFFLRGLFTDRDGLFRVWFWATVLFCAIFWRTVIQHAYYQLLLAPPAAYYAAAGFADCSRFLERRFFPRVIVWSVAAAAIVLSATFFYRGIYFIPEPQRRIVTAGKLVQEMTSPDALVAANYGGSTIQLYYCNRKGWAFDIRSTPDVELIRRLEALRSRGASYFVTTTFDQLSDVPEFAAYLRSHYTVVRETPQVLLVQLEPVRKPS